MKTEKLSANEIKQKNRQIIYDFIRNKGSVSKQEIVYGLQFSLPTVTQNLQYLTEQELIDTSKKITNTGGRNATAYEFLEKARAAVGIDITKHHIKAVVVDLAGEVIAVVRRREKFRVSDEYNRILGEVAEEVVSQSCISPSKVLGCGIAVPGLVSEEGSYVTHGWTLNFTGETCERFSKYIPYKTRLFHDAHAAGYAEVLADSNLKNAFYISLGSSVGGSVLIDNKVYYGDSHKAGEIGHLTLIPGGKQCYCGQKGCFETYCNGEVLASAADGDLQKFFEQLKAKDSAIEQIWDEYLDHLAIAVNTLYMLFDCPIILGGYVGSYMGEYMESLVEKAYERNPFKTKMYLRPCQYKIEAIAAGAAIMYIEPFLREI